MSRDAQPVSQAVPTVVVSSTSGYHNTYSSFHMGTGSVTLPDVPCGFGAVTVAWDHSRMICSWWLILLELGLPMVVP